jgi:hypothetical protein
MMQVNLILQMRNTKVGSVKFCGRCHTCGTEARVVKCATVDFMAICVASGGVIFEECKRLRPSECELDGLMDGPS